jgi:tRNA A37 threonylcarbamoyladenosine dehydratase
MRYARNMKALTPEENQKLKDSRVCIAGCGALGEYVFEMLGRIGVANLTIIDFDTFNTSNLNRQIYATGKALDQMAIIRQTKKKGIKRLR